MQHAQLKNLCSGKIFLAASSIYTLTWMWKIQLSASLRLLLSVLSLRGKREGRGMTGERRWREKRQPLLLSLVSLSLSCRPQLEGKMPPRCNGDGVHLPVWINILSLSLSHTRTHTQIHTKKRVCKPTCLLAADLNKLCSAKNEIPFGWKLFNI